MNPEIPRNTTLKVFQFSILFSLSPYMHG
jgi:hypothetical protein